MPVPALPKPSLPLHRIRFYDHNPSPVTALSFAPLPLPPARDPSSSKGKGREEQANGSSSESAAYAREEFGLLVLARENGDVEIWEWAREGEDGFGNWILSKVLPPTLTHPSVSLMTLVIRDAQNFHLKPYSVPRITDLRLFTSGSDSTDLVERCLLTGRLLHTYPIPSPPLWSLAVSPTHSLLCLATTSPSLHFLSIPADGPIEPSPPHLLRCDALPSRTRTVSVAWGIPKLAQNADDDWEWRDTYVVTGNSDSSFRKWDLPEPSDGSRAGASRVSLRSRAVVEKINKKNKKGNSKGTIVWGVGVLPDHTIVTSDSLGSVTFWDGASMAQKQTFAAHKADGMSMTIGPRGQTVFTSGPDQRVCQFTQLPSSTSTTTQWALTATKRIHTHDVRALSIFPPYVPAPINMQRPVNSGYAPILASGGWDMSLTFTPAAPASLLSGNLRNPLGKAKGMSRTVFEEAYVRKNGFFGGGGSSGRIAFSAGGRLVVGRKDRGVGIWHVLEDEEGWEKVLEMDLRLRTNLTAHAVSDNGKYLAISDLYETKLFSLVPGPGNTIQPRRLRSFLPTLLESPLLNHLHIATQGLGASSILFTPDSRRVILGLSHSCQIIVLELPTPERDDISVLSCLSPQAEVVGGRVVVGMKPKGVKKPRKRKEQVNGDAAAGEHDNGQKELDEDIVMGNSDEPEEQEKPIIKQDESDSRTGAWITTLAASADGQWLAAGDVTGRVTVVNLDTLQIHATLPTLPYPPAALLFPPTIPSLLVTVAPTNRLQFYHIESRKFLPTTPQINTLNSTLKTRFTPILNAAFEPAPSQSPRSGMNGQAHEHGSVAGSITSTTSASRGNNKNMKIVIWGSEWIATARLDLELLLRRAGGKAAAGLIEGVTGKEGEGTSQKALRRKRAREAREALEQTASTPASVSAFSDNLEQNPSPSVVSVSERSMSGMGTSTPVKSSSEDPHFVKIHGSETFRGIIGAGWFGNGELAVVERPWGDFVGDLPGQFRTAGFGKG